MRHPVALQACDKPFKVIRDRVLYLPISVCSTQPLARKVGSAVDVEQVWGCFGAMKWKLGQQCMESKTAVG